MKSPKLERKNLDLSDDEEMQDVSPGCGEISISSSVELKEAKEEDEATDAVQALMKSEKANSDDMEKAQHKPEENSE